MEQKNLSNEENCFPDEANYHQEKIIIVKNTRIKLIVNIKVCYYIMIDMNCHEHNRKNLVENIVFEKCEFCFRKFRK